MDFADNWNGSGNYKEKVSERTLQMNETQTFEQPYVFGLDIGTRNVVGTVGYWGCQQKLKIILITEQS